MIATTSKPQTKHSQSLLDVCNEAIDRLSVEAIYNNFSHDLLEDGMTGKYRGKPPFRESKSGQSFTVFPDKGFFDAGDGFAGYPQDYIHSMKVGRWEKAKGKDFADAVRELCDRANVSFPDRELSPQEIEQIEKWERRRAILSHTYTYCQGILNSPIGEKARLYLLNERGLGETAVKDRGLGFYDSAKSLSEYLQSKGFEVSEIKEAGVLSRKWEGFVTYPWFDDRNRPLTMYGRYQAKKPPEGLPKTLALPGQGTKQSPLYFDRVLKHRHKEIIFVEGVNDAAVLQSKGETRVCSGVAASFSREQIETLKRHGVQKVYHLGDPDGGGIGGTNSNLNNLTKAGITVYVPPELPEGLDPDEFVVKYGIETFKAHIAQSEHGFRWKAKQFIKEIGTDTDLGKDKLLETAVAWTHKIPFSCSLELEIYFWSELTPVLGMGDMESFRSSLEAKFVTPMGTATPPSGYPEKFDSGCIANWLVERYRNQLAWDVPIQEWRRYSATTEGVWSIEPVEFVRQVIQSEVEQIAPMFPDKQGNPPAITPGLIKAIEELMSWNLSVRRWDEDKGLLPLLNGVLDLETRKLSPHSPGHRLTWSLPYAYNPLAKCDAIQSWLLEMCQGDTRLIELIRAYLHGVVTGRTDWQKYLELIGPGGTGKSTIIRLAIALVGVNNTHTTTLQKLEGSRFETASVKDKRLVVITDSERYASSVSVLKALTGQDTLPYEVKFKQSTQGFTPDSLVIVAANEVIQSGDYTSGLERRRMTVPFTNKIPSSKQRNLIAYDNKGITGEFAPLIPGLLNWVLEMKPENATALVKDYTTQVPSLERMKAQTLIETNPIADWLDNAIIYRPEHRTNVGVAKRDKNSDSENWYLLTSEWLYANYCEYCHNTGTNPVAVRRFVNLLHDLCKNQLGLDISKGRDRNGSHFIGLKIRDENDKDDLLITGIKPDNKILGYKALLHFISPFDTTDNTSPDGDMVTDVTASVTASVTAETLASDECDGCDGYFETSIENQNENSEKNNQQNKGGFANLPSHRCDLSQSGVSPVTPSVTNPSPMPSRPQESASQSNVVRETQDTEGDSEDSTLIEPEISHVIYQDKIYLVSQKDGDKFTLRRSGENKYVYCHRNQLDQVVYKS